MDQNIARDWQLFISSFNFPNAMQGRIPKIPKGWTEATRSMVVGQEADGTDGDLYRIVVVAWWHWVTHHGRNWTTNLGLAKIKNLRVKILYL